MTETSTTTTTKNAARALFDHPKVKEYYKEMCSEGSFVDQMATDILSKDKYRAFLSQDSHFLYHFNRAYAMALVLSPNVEQQKIFHDLIGGVLEELNLHKGACERWGVLETEIHPACQAYVDFLQSLHDSKSLDGLVAGMVPCMRLYASLGQEFVAKNRIIKDCPYKEWFDEYFNEGIEGLAQLLESLLPETITTEIETNYIEAMRLERDFFAAQI
mmetsp:Transcript_41372/g.47032  ORF Transcript_41372/g.47032 Transcript_41372/m.47032 type:complete len:216 (+) Transcript_41372:42-689(+)